MGGGDGTRADSSASPRRAPDGLAPVGTVPEILAGTPGDDTPVLPDMRFRSDQQAFGAIVAEHHVRLARLAFMLCGNRQQAEDAVADAYARVWPRYRRGRIDDLVPYLRRAVVNQINGGFRRRFLERREEERHTVDLRDDHRDHRSVEDRELLGPALQALPVAQRMVIVLRFLEDLSEEETALILGIKLGTVKSRAARALEQLRRVLGEEAL